jgi:hypothetical protein
MAALDNEGWAEGLRFNDLRHQSITELCEAGLFDMTIMVIAGHVSREMLMHDPTDEGQGRSRTMLKTVQPTPSNPVKEPQSVTMN